MRRECFNSSTAYLASTKPLCGGCASLIVNNDISLVVFTVLLLVFSHKDRTKYLFISNIDWYTLISCYWISSLIKLNDNEFSKYITGTWDSISLDLMLQKQNQCSIATHQWSSMATYLFLFAHLTLIVISWLHCTESRLYYDALLKYYVKLSIPLCLYGIACDILTSWYRIKALKQRTERLLFNLSISLYLPNISGFSRILYRSSVTFDGRSLFGVNNWFKFPKKKNYWICNFYFIILSVLSLNL